MNISVIVCAYNAERYIGCALRSCYEQSFDKLDYEIIVIHDGSTDESNNRTLQAISPFFDFYKGVPPVLRIIKHKQNQGIASASNTGIRAAIGQYIVRVDADDYISEKLLEVEYMYLSMNKDYDAVACDYFEVDEFENVLSRKDSSQDPIACGVMFRKDRLVDIGLYDPQFALREDKDLRIRFLSKFNIMRIPLPLYRYRKHKGECTKSPQIEEYEKKLLSKHSTT